MNKDHEDFTIISEIVEAIASLTGDISVFRKDFPIIVQDAVDFVIDPIRTARTKIADLDNVEKTFIGLKIEHFLRDYLGVPKGLRDLRIGELDVDVKNTVSGTWMIPPETFTNKEPCVLVMVATEKNQCSLGVFVAREKYLNAPNRDGKRSVSRKAFENIWWLLSNEDLPESRFEGLDMARFRELRDLRGGNKRASQFFRENLNRFVHRTVVLGLLFDQNDPMKRLRGNGGIRDILASEGIAILSGAYHSNLLIHFGHINVKRDEFCAVRFTANDRSLLLHHGYFNKKN